MDKLWTKDSGPRGKLAGNHRPHSVPLTTPSSRRRHTSGGTRQTRTHIEEVTSCTGQWLVPDEEEPPRHSRLENTSSSLVAVATDETGIARKEESKQVMKNATFDSQVQLDTLLKKVCDSSAATVDYAQFLRRFSQAPVAHRACSSMRCRPQKPSMSLFEIQRHLKDKIGGNLKTVIRAFDLFDCNREGHIQQHELRRILDNCCIHLTDKEFQRLWNHYGSTDATTISYKLFLDQLGLYDGHNFKIAPVCTKLEVSGQKTTPRKQRPASVSSSCDTPSVLPHRKLQTLFYDKMCMNSTSVWRALQAVDTARSGLVKQDVLRAVLSSFIFPMTPHLFQKLTSRYGVRATGPVRWKHFLGHFMSSAKEESDASLQTERASELPGPHQDGLDSKSIYPQIKELFHQLDKEEHKTADESQTTQWADKVPVTSASWRKMKHSLADKLCERSNSVLAALKLRDPQHTGYVTREDLRRVLSCCGMSISHTLFNKLCESISSRPGHSSQLVFYHGFLKNLGVPLTTAATNLPSGRPFTSPQFTQQPVGCERPPSGLQDRPDTCNILDVVFQRMRMSLEKRHSSLAERIQTITHSSEETLSEADVRKILEDSDVILNSRTFSRLTELLGFIDGQIKRSVFQEKYEEATASGGQQCCEDGDARKDKVDRLLSSAEQCLAVMKTRIKIIHGNNLAAFRLMDKKRKGLVDCHDFKTLYDSLGFLCSETEYQCLLDLIGLHAGGNLNYTEFNDVVENNGKQVAQKATMQEQLHQLLVCEAHHKWAEISKSLCQCDTDGQVWIYKKSLRQLFFTYSLPLASSEFEQLWSRYDPEGQGHVAVCDFLEKLGFHRDREMKSQGQKLKQNVAQLETNRTASFAAASPQDSEVTVSMNDGCKKLSDIEFLSGFDHKEEKKCDPPLASPNIVHQFESLQSLSLDEALARMQQLVQASAPDLYKAFSAFDQSGTGMVKALVFRQVLESFCARLSDKQYRYMLTRLELDSEKCTVNWKDFLMKFHPLNPPSEFVWCQTPVTDQNNLQSRESLQCFGCSRVTSPCPEPRETKSATQPHRPNTAGAILQHAKSSPQCIPRHPASVKRLGTGSPLGNVERRLHGAVQRCWKEIQRKCAEEDRQQEGRISASSFLEILRSLNINLTLEQFDRLALKFDLKKDGAVSYHDFLRYFLLNLKPAETKRRQNLPLPIAPMSQGVLTKDCVKLMLRTYDVVRSSWTSIRRGFLTFDRSRTGSVSVQDFRKVLSHFRVNLSEEEFFHLCSYFDADTSGRICYDSFLWVFLH